MIKSNKARAGVCAIVLAAGALALTSSGAAAICGMASWYNYGKLTANGEAFRPSGMTAAHRSLPFGTRVEVKDMSSGRSVTVRINDRGPFIGGRIIDLTQGAARRLGFEQRGLTHVCIRPVGKSRSR